MKRLLALATLLVFAATGCTASHEQPSNAARSSKPFHLSDPGGRSGGSVGDHLGTRWLSLGYRKAGKRVTRVNPADGSKSTVITITDVYSTQSQDSLLGFAFQPNFLKGNNDVYLAYTYGADPGPGS